MTGFRLQINPRSAFRAVLAAGLLVMLGANLPGHLSYDSVAQLYEGHFHIRETWGPAIYAWILGPNADITNLFACDRFPPKGANVPRFCDREVDRALERYDLTYDERGQRAALRFVQERLLRDVPTIVLDAREDVFAYNDDLHGFQPNHVTAFDDLVDADI